jgi:hypothetical protein
MRCSIAPAVYSNPTPCALRKRRAPCASGVPEGAATVLRELASTGSSKVIVIKLPFHCAQPRGTPDSHKTKRATRNSSWLGISLIILTAGVSHHRELLHPNAPTPVRAFIACVYEPTVTDTSLAHLDEGEAAAIFLVEQMKAPALLIDERAGVDAARDRGLRITGTRRAR